MGLLSKLLLAVLSATYYWNGATAQKTTAVCEPGTYDWMINTMGQSPCVVASFIEGVCSDSVFSIAALPAGRHYVGPSEPDFATPCICSSVAYNLVSACGICQGATETQKWSSWITNCTGQVDANGYPKSVPSGTSVPAWAYQDIVATDEFDPNEALRVAGEDLPDVGPNGSTISASHKKSKPIGAIVGGVVGGILLLGLIGVLGTYCILKRSRSRQAPSAAKANHIIPAPSYMSAVPEPQHIVTPYPLSPPAGVPLLYDNTGGYTPSEKPYDPNDPSTYPFGSTPGVYHDILPRSASGPPGSVYTSAPSIAPNPYEHYSPSPAPLVPNRGGYTGAPEI